MAFDRDEAGVKEWRLDGTFVSTDLFADVKTSTNGKSFAVLLPVPDFRADCAKHLNLPIEFLFPDEYLATTVDGKRLELRPIMATRKLGEETIRLKIGDETAFQQIEDNSKLSFAKIVVPRMPDEAFVAFDGVFSIFEDILSKSMTSK